MKKKIIIAVAVAALVIGLAYVFRDHQSAFVGTANSQGSTYSTGPVMAGNINTASSTFYSQLAVSDFLASDFKFHAYGGSATTSNYVIQCATSSTQYAPTSNVNLLVNTTISPYGSTTGSNGVYIASTSPGISGSPFANASTTVRLVPAGSYLVCTSTNSVAGANSLNTFDSNTAGIVGFEGFKE